MIHKIILIIILTITTNLVMKKLVGLNLIYEYLLILFNFIIYQITHIIITLIIKLQKIKFKFLRILIIFQNNKFFKLNLNIKLLLSNVTI